MKFYSQTGQDYWVNNIFKGLKNGYFVDIGAANGVFISNTYFLEKELNWTGICVEPNKYLLPSIRENRKCLIDDSVIGFENQKVNYVGYDADIHRQMFSYASDSTLDMYDERIVLNSKYVEPRIAISINNLLDKHNSPSIIHYLSIDINNNDVELIKDYFVKSYNSKRKILSMTIEHNDEGVADELNKFLFDYDYLPDFEHHQDNNYVIKNIESFI